MKIALIGQKGIPAVSGGIEKHVEEISIRMAEAGHNVFVYVRDNYTDKNLKKYKKIVLIHLPSIHTKHLDAISHTFVSTIHALFSDYDVIHYHGIGPSFLSWIIKFFKPSVSLVSTFHCQDYYHQKWGWFACLFLKAGEYMTCIIPDKTIAVSKSLADLAKEKYGKRLTVIPNGADIKYAEATNLISQWGLKDKKYILFVGRLIKHKGVHYLIEAFKQLEDTSKLANNFKLVITGEGFHTDDYVKYLRTISEKRENIIFTGKQSNEVLEQLFSHSYLFVQPSESEGLSIALLEAMGYGICPLVSDIKENLEPVSDCGYSFKNKSVTDLRDKLAYLLNKPEEVERLGSCAVERIRNEYSWDSIAEKTLNLYREIILQKEK
ncbi:MAG: Glycosyltransferase [uncultured bacterium]|nr:MAG: Glycosyltransferase [uncultured bacterium]HBR71339.1 glycosyl transferase family 1 [Candidatus Moranbacteria bacterium]